MEANRLHVLVANPRGFGTGVERAVATVERVPEVLVGEAIERLRFIRPLTNGSLEGIVEDIAFRLPSGLLANAAPAAP